MRFRPLTTLVLLAVIVTGAIAQEKIIKFASIAPEGTSWLVTMKELDAAVRKETGGKVGFRIYAGGSQGEDKDFIRKMRLGQLHAAGITGVGLGEIAPKVRILDSPFLFQNTAEVDHVLAAFDAEFSRAFEENGYVLLGWAEVGFANVFTNKPVKAIADMKGVKMWMWEGDPVAEAAFKALDIRPIPLSVIDVMTSLQTGLIDGAYASPYGAVALSWHTRVKYMMNPPLANAMGAVVITKKMFDTLTPEQQEVVTRNGRKFMAELTRRSREDNAKALGTLTRNNVQTVDATSPGQLKEFAEIGRRARQSLVGKLYDQDLLTRVEKAVADFRAKGKPGK